MSAATITAAEFAGTWGRVTITATLSDGAREVLFSYYADELTFSEAELVGRTVPQARALRHERDVAYLRT